MAPWNERGNIMGKDSKKFTALTMDALDQGVTTTGGDGDGFLVPIRFITSSGEILAWMYRKRGKREWVGFTANPDITGKKNGTKCQVANWCLDWAVNGF